MAQNLKMRAVRQMNEVVLGAGEKIIDAQDIVAIGGTGGGADTAVVLRAANQNRFFNLKIREIIGMPR